MKPDLDEIKAAAKAATPGRWRLFDRNGTRAVLKERCKTELVAWMGFDRSEISKAQHGRNATYIATMNPPTTLALVAEIERMQENEAKLCAALEPFAKHSFEPEPPDDEWVEHRYGDLRTAARVLVEVKDRNNGGKHG